MLIECGQTSLINHNDIEASFNIQNSFTDVSLFNEMLGCELFR